MRTQKKKLSRDEYEKLRNRPHEEISKWLEDLMPMCIKIGYGYYGCGTPYEQDGEYYIDYSIGDHCD